MDTGRDRKTESSKASGHPFGSRAEQLSGDHYWFPVLRGLIESGAPAQLGPIAIAAYLVIKASSDFKTGTADASAREVAAAVGCSERAARTAIKRLVDFGLLSSSTVNGRRPTFQLREMLPLRAANGDERAWVSFPFSADEFSVRVKKAAEAAVAEALGRVAGPAVNAPISITAGSFSISVHLHFPGAPNGG